MVKAFLFDLGNTLIEYPRPEDLKANCADFISDEKTSQKILDQTHKLYLQDRLVSFRDLHEATIRKALTQALAEEGCQLDDQKILGLMKEIYQFGFARHAKVIDGARQLLSILKGKGLKTGIVSNTPFPGSFYMDDLERFGLLPYFQTFLWSSDFGKRKPSPDIFEKALDNLEVKAQEAVFIGDSLDRDISGSRGVGMRSIWFNRKKKVQNHDGYRISSLLEIFSFKELFE